MSYPDHLRPHTAPSGSLAHEPDDHWDGASRSAVCRTCHRAILQQARRWHLHPLLGSMVRKPRGLRDAPPPDSERTDVCAGISWRDDPEQLRIDPRSISPRIPSR